MFTRALVAVAMCLGVGLASTTVDGIVSAQGVRAQIRGSVTDDTGAAFPGAQVVAAHPAAGTVASAVTDAQGAFALVLPPGVYTFTVSSDGFVDATRRVAVGSDPVRAQFTLHLAGIRESVRVGGAPGYSVPAVSSATKTYTPLRDVPQAVSVVPRALIDDQRMSSMADVARYMPGVGFAQGEGNRDTPVMRGNSTTADFFVDGVRDDVQYLRDVYNVDRVEALKGPNAMVFGRGGVGGVINRVTRQAEWGQMREASVQFGAWNNKRFTADLGAGVSDALALRTTAVYEQSDSYRRGVTVERYGFNPTAAFRLGGATTLRAGYEFFRDERIADRGVSSVGGRPLATDRRTFFGDPSRSPVAATVHLASATLDHRFNARATLRNRTSIGGYDKFYQNVFPGAVNAAADTVAISAYNNGTTRLNVFNQTDVTLAARSGRLSHLLLFGTEFGRQRTENLRQTGYFTSLGSNVATSAAPLRAPTVALPLEFRQSPTDADNRGVVTIAAAYVQDQITLSRHVDVVAGVRFDQVRANVMNNRTAATFTSDDGLVSPRLGLVFKPVQPLSLYASSSLTYLPRAGEQLASLTLTNQALDPETFRNYEVGAKWDVNPALALTAAVYRLDRGNVAVPHPTDPTLSLLVDAQRTRGVEVEWTGQVARGWSVAGGYAYQDGEITRSISAAAQAGATLAHVPKHALSVWSKHQLTARLAAAVGVLHREHAFASTDNLVTLPRWTRVDAAAYYDVTPKLRAQVNVENVLDGSYFASAHSNTNIMPGSPRAVRLALTTRF